jgi:hypothetical protein
MVEPSRFRDKPQQPISSQRRSSRTPAPPAELPGWSDAWRGFSSYRRSRVPPRQTASRPKWNLVRERRQVPGRDLRFDTEFGQIELRPGNLGSLSYTSYTRPPLPGRRRAVAFCFGGGPGASSASYI